jgi:hypothetical protein
MKKKNYHEPIYIPSEASGSLPTLTTFHFYCMGNTISESNAFEYIDNRLMSYTDLMKCIFSMALKGISVHTVQGMVLIERTVCLNIYFCVAY